MDKRPIGFFDSGFGGASVLHDARRMLPTENYIYFGDNKYAPYGDKSEDEITALTLSCAQKLISLNVKAIVIACNTATATCINEIRRVFDVPVISVEPAIKPACESDGNGKILMLATLATTRLQRYLELQKRMPDPDRVINVPCPGLVELIESGHFSITDFDDVLDSHLKPYHSIDVDGIVLGCTHYVFIKDALEHYMRRNFTGAQRFYDGNAATVRQLGRVIKSHEIENACGNASVEFRTSGDYSTCLPLFDMLLKRQ